MELDIKLDHRAIAIDIDNKRVSFEKGKQVPYENLISSLPLPTIISLLKDSAIDVKETAENLYALQCVWFRLDSIKRLKFLHCDFMFMMRMSHL